MTDPLFSTLVVGDGPEKLIAVHGWMGDHRLFDPLRDLIDGTRLADAQSLRADSGSHHELEQ